VDPLAVGALAQLVVQLRTGDFERRTEVGGAGLGPHHRALGTAGDLDTLRVVGLAGVGLVIELDIDVRRSVVVLGDLRLDLLRDELSEVVGNHDVSALDDDFHLGTSQAIPLMTGIADEVAVKAPEPGFRYGGLRDLLSTGVDGRAPPVGPGSRPQLRASASRHFVTSGPTTLHLVLVGYLPF
jgi:hypothetical protein